MIRYIPVTFNVDGELEKGVITLSSDATEEEIEAFEEIMRLTEVNTKMWNILKNQYGDRARGILI